MILAALVTAISDLLHDPLEEPGFFPETVSEEIVLAFLDRYFNDPAGDRFRVVPLAATADYETVVALWAQAGPVRTESDRESNELKIFSSSPHRVVRGAASLLRLFQVRDRLWIEDQDWVLGFRILFTGAVTDRQVARLRLHNPDLGTWLRTILEVSGLSLEEKNFSGVGGCGETEKSGSVQHRIFDFSVWGENQP